jgi:hypothetical protein
MTDAEQLQENDQEAPEPGIGFGDLRDGRCKFPLGVFHVPPTRFCGDPTRIGTVYCPKNQTVAYNRLNTRR